VMAMYDPLEITVEISDGNSTNNNSDSNNIKICSRCHQPLKEGEKRICLKCKRELKIGEWAKL